MKKKRITYGVTGMMEYQAVIKIGRSQMKVLFTDGSATGYGMNPAMYTTDNLIVQKAIENSDQFKRGRIHIVSSTDLEEEVQVINNGVEGVAGQRDEIRGGEFAGEAEAPEAEAAHTEQKPLIEMEFDNNDDAKDYLEQTFGCVRSKLRNREEIKAAGEANGVSISFS